MRSGMGYTCGKRKRGGAQNAVRPTRRAFDDWDRLTRVLGPLQGGLLPGGG